MITDEYNFKFKPYNIPFMVALLLFMIGVGLGFNTGYGINPARDFGPRIFTAFIYGGEVFSAYDYWFWIPTFVPFIGAILGGYMYHFALGHWNYRNSL